MLLSVFCTVLNYGTSFFGVIVYGHALMSVGRGLPRAFLSVCEFVFLCMPQHRLVFDSTVVGFVALLSNFHVNRNCSSAEVETQPDEDEVWACDVTADRGLRCSKSDRGEPRCVFLLSWEKRWRCLQCGANSFVDKAVYVRSSSRQHLLVPCRRVQELTAPVREEVDRLLQRQ